MIFEQRLTETCLEDQALAGMFEARKQVFVDLLKWDLPVLDGRFEIDQFDDRHACYLIVADTDGVHLGSARILSSERQHILGGLYPDLCNSGVPAGAGIAEITRFCLDRNQNAAERRHTRNRLVSAIVRHAIVNDIHLYTGVAEYGWLQQILAFGWKCRPLGPPRRFAGAMLGALAIEIGEDTPALLAANGIWVEDEPAILPALEAA